MNTPYSPKREPLSIALETLLRNVAHTFRVKDLCRPDEKVMSGNGQLCQTDGSPLGGHRYGNHPAFPESCLDLFGGLSGREFGEGF